jgi:glycogen(starch) synthase
LETPGYWASRQLRVFLLRDKPNNRLRVFYAAGPGDVVGTFRYWREGRADPRQPNVTYSGQFFSTCLELGVEARVVSSNPRRDSTEGEGLRVTNQPRWLELARGPLYHFSRYLHGIRLVRWIRKFDADIVFVSEGSCEWSALRRLPASVGIVPVMHCMLWPKVQSPSTGQRLSAAGSKWLFAERAFSILSASRDITEQVRFIAGSEGVPVRHFLPTYRRAEFDAVRRPSFDGQEFRLFFAGRIEVDKGVFHLLDMADMLRGAAPETKVRLDLCGTGSVLEELRRRVKTRQLEGIVTCHGYCESERLRDILGRSHAVIVPTTSAFIEGFNQVVVEGVLAHRPVITSRVCPALDYVRDAVEEVPPNDVAAYADAAVRLARTPELYERRVTACKQLRDQFFDPGKGFGAVVKETISKFSGQFNRQ